VKIIFSRKGFDSSSGGFPSPIFPDGTLFSVPIPSSKDDHYYNRLLFHYEGESIQDILNQLTCRQIDGNLCDYNKSDQRCHHDPLLLNIQGVEKLTLGQANGAESHLRNYDVGAGDIFLFFGWFRKVVKTNGCWAYDTETPHVHVIWASMTVGEAVILDAETDREAAFRKYPDLLAHPHAYHRADMKNCIYISSAHQILKLKPECFLTDVNNYRGRSTWRLPNYFGQPEAFTYIKKFVPDGKDVVIQAPGRGQEFILDLDHLKSQEDRHLILGYVDSLIR